MGREKGKIFFKTTNYEGTTMSTSLANMEWVEMEWEKVPPKHKTILNRFLLGGV